MSKKVKYRIFLEACDEVKDFPLPAGYYGPVTGVTQNHYIYCRTSFEKAWKYTDSEAVSIICDMRAFGYRCHAEPPITITF